MGTRFSLEIDTLVACPPGNQTTEGRGTRLITPLQQQCAGLSNILY